MTDDGTTALIAIEEHWTTPELAAALEALPDGRRDPSLVLNAHGGAAERLHDLGEGRIRRMDEQGIDVQILSVAPPATGPLDPADAVSLSRDLNDIAAAAVGEHPTRFRAMASLPMASPRDAAAELERAASLGLVGTMVYGRTGERHLDDPAYDDVLATAARLGAPVFIHPQIPAPATRQAQYAGFAPFTELALSTFSWGWHIEAATAALRLIASGAFDRHPDLKLVLGHWGELLLFWGSRTESLSGIAGLERKVSEVVRENVYVTSSGMLEPALLRHVLTVTDVDHVMFSTDYPFQDPSAADIQAFLGEFASDQDRESFGSGVARALFGLGDL